MGTGWVGEDKGICMVSCMVDVVGWVWEGGVGGELGGEGICVN